MDPTMTAVEVSGTIDENSHLHLDSPVPIRGPVRVRVIVLYSHGEEVDETQWLHAASQSPAFDDLNDPREDIYSLDDGEPFRDEA